MDFNILISIALFIIGMFTGFIFATIFFKKRSSSQDSSLVLMLTEFKNSIDSYKNQTIINTKEIQGAIETASKLTKTLTTNQNLKGQFGEECLEEILKACFPSEKINYIKQISTLNAENKQIKPDFLVKLPNDKSIIIDCKLNLEKYIDYKENPDDNTKKSDFIKDLNSTINNLAQKKYETAVDTIQPDFVLMYIPLEPVLTLIYTDNDFLSVIKNAIQKNIIIVGNSSVLTTIKLTKLLWAQDAQEKNIDNIVNIAKSVYNLIAQHSQNLYNIKKIMNENLENFNKEYKKIAIDNKLFKLTQELESYGIQSVVKKTGKKLDSVKIHSEFLIDESDKNTDIKTFYSVK